MTSNRCARCGREPPAGTFEMAHSEAGAEVFILGTLEGAWASLGGQDVCPACQSPDERRVVAGRIAAMVEREIERRQREGVPPDANEAALVAYAMATRAAAGDDRPEDTTDAEAPEPAGKGDRVRLRVAVTGAFLTGHPLSVRISGYGELQHDLGGVLKAPKWQTAGLRQAGGTYESGGGLLEEAPLVIARRDGADLLPWLSSAISAPDEMGRDPLRGSEPIEAATPKRLSVDVYDLGVAVLTAWLDVVAAPDAELSAIATAMNQLVRLRADDQGGAPFAEALQAVADATTGEYGDAMGTVRAELRAAWRSWEQATTITGPARNRSGERSGRLLWLHPVNVLLAATPRQAVAQELAPTFRETVEVRDGFFSAGIGWSAVVSRTSIIANGPLQLTKLHWAYYALYMGIDRTLLEILDHPRWKSPASLKDLEKESDDVFADYLWVMHARARLDSHLGAKGGDEFAVWEAIAKVQRFDALAAAVGHKLEVLEKLANRRVDQATAARTTRITSALGWISGLTFVTLAAALVTTLLGPMKQHDWWRGRVTIVLLGLLAACAFYWGTYRRTLGFPGMRRRRRLSRRA